jgi:FKBP-type peptidyl-prolyl cis-trans isomerase
MMRSVRSGACLLTLVGLVWSGSGCTLKEDTTTIPVPVDVAAPPADAIKTASGLASKILRLGVNNVRPNIRSTVKVHYSGWTTDGHMFDSSVARNEPLEFSLTRVIAGWTEGLQLMTVGEKRRFWIPGNLAYDVPGAREDAPKGMLVFDIELLAVR